MKISDTSEQKKRVEELRDFYTHVTIFVIINLFLFLLNVITSPDSLWFHWPLLGWSVGMVLHVISVFGSGPLSGSDWEEKKIREIMDEYDEQLQVPNHLRDVVHDSYSDSEEALWDEQHSGVKRIHQ